MKPVWQEDVNTLRPCADTMGGAASTAAALPRAQRPTVPPCTFTSDAAHRSYLQLVATGAPEYKDLQFPVLKDQTASQFLRTPVHAAAYCGCPRILEQELDRIPNRKMQVLEDEAVPVVVPAARAGQHQLLKHLHDTYNVDLHKPRSGGWTPLKYAAARLVWAAKYGGEWKTIADGLVQTILYLLEDAQGGGQYSSADDSHRALVADLKDAGRKDRVSINVGPPGWNLLHAAAHLGNAALAEWLVTNAVFRADELDSFGRRPYEVADLAGHHMLASFLADEAAVVSLAASSRQYIQGIMVTAALVATVTFVGFATAPAGTMPTPFKVDQASFDQAALMAFFWLNACSFYLAKSTIIACTFSLFPSFAATGKMHRTAQLLMVLLLLSVALFVAAFGAAGFVVLHQSGAGDHDQGFWQALAMACFGTLVCILPASLVAHSL